MSKIEVDAITEQSGSTLTAGGGAGKTVVVDATTVTLGRCGGTVALASGASQTGFGRTGTVDWITTPKTTGTFTAVSGEGYFLNTSGGVITANLPAGVAGAIVSFADYAATWQTNNVTVTPNGTDKIGSLNLNAILSVQGQSVTFVFVDSTQGWINTMDSTSNVRAVSTFIVASGGTPTTSPCGDFKIHTFTGPGTFCVSQAGTPAGSNTVDYLVVAGGGGGGAGCGGGGGAGGGGMRFSFPNPATGGLPVSAQGYTITVGGGGTKGSGAIAPSPGASARCGTNGGVSTFSTITSAGGGYGGAASGTNPGGNGGSGGGGGRKGNAGSGNNPTVSPSQGNPGGGGAGGPSGSYGGGAGGGHNAAGPGGSGNAGGNGGAGSALLITGSSVNYAGGGGGGGFPVPCNAQSTGGAGGGGRGAPASLPLDDMDGTDNTGGGGGGGSESPAYGPISPGQNDSPGGSGGSGIVVIRYKFQ
jgi:hypothetical protein